MTPEDIGDIFQELEDALFAMAIRNMDAHQNWEKEEGFKWTQWQAEQIKGLREYREKVNIMTNKGFDEANEAVKEFLQEAYDGSVDDTAGLAVKAGKGDVRPAFFGVNSDKMNIILDEAVKDIDTKRYACINRMNSGYTDFLRKADIFAQSGSMTIPQALDYAMKDFLAAGLNCVEYSNGNRVNIASYAEMALRTSSSEVTRQANGDVRDALGEHLVVSNVIGMTCPYCQKWQGKVMIDDVYSDGKPDGEHRLVSEAKADHFLHPNCRHQLFMYIEGITEIADLPNDVETKEHYKAEQEQRRQEREIRKYKRLRDGAVDPADRQKYDARVKEWTQKHDEYLSERPYLRKNPKRLAMGYTGNGKPEITYEFLDGKELKGKITYASRYAVKKNYENSAELRRKIYSVAPEGAEEEFRNKVRQTLRARSGSNGEDLHFYDINTGEWESNTSSKIASGVNVNDKMKAMINKSKERHIISIHNHPASMPPSREDLNCAYDNRYKYGLIVGHDGTVYLYTPPVDLIPKTSYDTHYKKAKEMGMSEKDAQFYTLSELSKVFKFRLEVI